MQPYSKSLFRRYCLRRMQRLAEQPYVYGIDKRLSYLLERLVNAEKSRCIMAYIPLPSEVDVLPLINRWRRQGIEVWVPYMQGESFRLVKYKLPLKRKRFGVREPACAGGKSPATIDTALVPVVAIDGRMRRIGYGKGMYDRFFHGSGVTIKQTVFVARKACFIPQCIGDRHDIVADTVITA